MTLMVRWSPNRRRLADLLLGVLVLALSSQLTAADRVAFNRDIRPLLSDRCFFCHGPDASHREADLRLDTEAGLLGTAEARSAVIPGDAAASELWRRITSDDPEVQMPPPSSGKSLTAEEKATIRAWIEQGAPWQGHWAFQPIQRPPVPSIATDQGSLSPIDAFVRDGLTAAGLSPAGPADRHTLIRRLSFDLLGLPPTPEEVREFIADDDPAAYEKLVERYLESPHYGERMAQWWLDLVRYADSVGYHGDQPVSVSPFRDYVIRSFNENRPFDQFTREQLAGDLLPDATLEHRIASGYNRLGMMSAEGGVQPREYLAKYVAERVRNLGGAWLGLTTGCCECHDHKYDPLSARDFYSLEAFFADIQERGLYSGAGRSGDWGSFVPVPTPEQLQRLAEIDAQIARAREALERADPALDAAQRNWEEVTIPWTVLKPVHSRSSGGAKFKTLPDGSLLVSGKQPAQDDYTLTIASPPEGITALRLEVLPDDSLPQKGPGRATNGNFVLTEFLARMQLAGGQQPEESDAAATPLIARFSRASATFEQTAAGEKSPYGRWTVSGAIDGDEQGASWGWAILEQVGKQNAAVLELAEPLAGGPNRELVIELRQRHTNPGHTIGRFRLLATTAARTIGLDDAAPAEIASVLSIPASERSDEQRQTLRNYFRSITPLLKAERDQLAHWQAERKQVDDAVTTTLVTVAVEPRTIRVLPRGNWMDESGDIVSPAVPEILRLDDAAPEHRLTRLDLAEWLMDRRNPLTARVFVNRLWKLFFGAGLSRKLDDVGAQGDWPTHPELLDWLASEFIDSGWDVKHVIRLMVLSQTYRQSSQETEEQRARDPFNHWLSHQSRFRLDAETVRDSALRISGLLVERIGGPSVKPYQPPGYWSYLNFPTREWQNGRGAELYRRGLYTHWQRQYLHPSLAAFDAPSREECAADRPRSSTPLQTLVLMNDPSYVEAAKAFAVRLLQAENLSDADRLRNAFEIALARDITPAELEVLEKVLVQQRAEFRSDAERVKELLSVGEYRAPESLDGAEVAAWTSVARTILLLHEAITRP